MLECLDLKPINKCKAILPGFKRISIVGAVYPTAIRKTGSQIEGMIYQVAAEDLKMLDIYEGVEQDLFAKTEAVAEVDELKLSVFVYTKGSLLTDVLED